MLKKSLLKHLLDDFVKSGEVQSIHIDEVFPPIGLQSKRDLISGSVEICNSIIQLLYDVKEINVEIQIELEERAGPLVGAPSNMEELIADVDLLSMPELFLSKPRKIDWPPRIEYYSSPLVFSIENMNLTGYSIYEEYRVIEDQKKSLPFSRWLTLGYIN